MQDHEYNMSKLKQTTISSITRPNLGEILELLLNSHDIHILTRVLSTLGIYILSPEIHNEKIIKCDALYGKIALVLNSGVQAKTTVALNLMSAMLYLKDGAQMREKSLHIYTQNMIRISGCLTAMTNLFINFMLQQDTLKALCRSISEACRDCTYNQTYCSHLVPLCIRRCRGARSDTCLVLQSLLSRHGRNVQLFYESNGVTIFTRESLQHEACLRLLNTVVENTNDENKDILLKSSHIFEHLRYLLHRYGASNSIGQWATVILFSHRKVLRRNDEIKNISVNRIKEKECYCYSRNDISDKRLTETNELFRNILNEVIGIHNADYRSYNHRGRKNNKGNYSEYRDAAAFDTKGVPKKNAKDVQYQTDNSIVRNYPTANNDLSFSFLLEEARRNKLKDQTFQPFKYNQNTTPNINNTTVSSYKQTTKKFTQKLGKICNPTLTQEGDKDTTFSFAPPFVSTPKHKKKTVTMSQSSRLSFPRSEVSKRKCDRKTRINSKMYKKYISENKKIQNKTIGAKLFDIVNGSCTTLVKSFTSFRNIFRSKEPSISYKNVSSDASCSDPVHIGTCSSSFTTYMRDRDAACGLNKDETVSKNVLNVEDDNFRSCNTCDNTIALKQKLTNDATLQTTLKRLKFGINLYGCDFKKISRTMWPNEHYMTPSVLYNLYRKLIIK